MYIYMYIYNIYNTYIYIYIYIYNMYICICIYIYIYICIYMLYNGKRFGQVKHSIYRLVSPRGFFRVEKLDDLE